MNIWLPGYEGCGFFINISINIAVIKTNEVVNREIFFKVLYPHSSLYTVYWCEPTLIKAWHFSVVSIIVFEIECAEAWSLKKKKCVTLDCKQGKQDYLHSTF